MMNTQVNHSRHWLALAIASVVLATLACNLTNSIDSSSSGDPAERPLVLLLVPTNGETYAEGVVLTVQAYVQVNTGSVARIEFRVDDLPIGEQTADDPEAANALRADMTWAAQGQSGHLITVEAFGQDGASLGLADATINVVANPLPQLPTQHTQSENASAAGSDGADATATPIPTPTGNAAATNPVARVNTAELNVRQGPAPTYPVVGMLFLNDPVEIVGRNADGDWWAIAYRGGTAWVFADLVTPEDDVSQVPLVAPPG